MNTNTIDLQIQSTASDGKHAPREIVAMAKEEGLQVISLTDHDTVAGVAEALEAGREMGVRVIPGIEMSVEEHGCHILGYGLDDKNPELLSELEKFRQGRIEGAREMVANLKKEGFVVDWEDVQREATGAVFARPHIARAVLHRPENKEKLGGVDNVHDFIEHFLANESPNYVPRSHIAARDAISLIHRAGGVAVWSHPAIHFRGDYEALEKFFSLLKEWGIDGLEVFNPSHTEDDAEYLLGLVKRSGLLSTAGSDFHDKKEHARDPATGLHSADRVGDYETHGFATDNVVPRLDEAISRFAAQ